MEEELLTDVIRDLEADGYPPLLTSRPGGLVRCATCGVETPAGEWTIEAIHRLEGESDPEEEVIVLGMVGPDSPCGCRGSLVLGYGPGSSAEDRAVLAHLDLPRAEVRGRA